MIPIDGYQVHSIIQEGSQYSVFAGSSLIDGRPVRIKYLSIENITDIELSQVTLSAERAATLHSEHAARLLDIRHIRHHNREGIAFIFEPHEGMPVREYLGKPPVDIVRFLNIAAQLAQAVNDIHRIGLIHNEIKPSVIAVIPVSETALITDFGLHTFLSHEERIVYNADILKDALPYISPEQTGRMDRRVDYRTDFYSLGAVFYELLTGEPPFHSNDPVKILHGHMAGRPAAAAERIPEIPLIISAIVMKLLAKNPEDRYQSAFGLYADLARCRKEIETQHVVKPFALGEKDKPEKFCLSPLFYGRENEKKILTEASGRALAGRMEVLMITGYSGIGKSRLIQEISSPMMQAGFFFALGKCEQYRKSVPYSAILQAFTGLMKQILAQSRERIAEWAARFAEALGPNSRLIVDVIPELEWITGAQPSVTPLPPDETRNRFQLVFGDFVRACAGEGRPLFLFLDDLQWADSSSLTLLKFLLTSANLTHVFFIGAYRDAEVDASHPLASMLNSLKEANLPIDAITLAPLDETDIRRMIADSLKQGYIQVHPLSRLIYQKTGGNPFFVTQFLKSLAATGLIVFDYVEGEWRWDMETIEKADITENVADLMAARLKTLPEQTRTCLEKAACIGGRFTLDTLAVIGEQTIEETAMAVWNAIEEGLLVPLEDAYRHLIRIVLGVRNRLYMDGTEAAPLPERIRIAFPHDRVQQTAYELIPPHHRQALHLTIARALQANAPAETIDDQLFDIVNQFDSALNLLTNPDEKRSVARLNAQAAQKARVSAAFSQALDYFDAACRLLESGDWEQDYALALAVHFGCAECAYLTGDFNRMDAMIGRILENSRTPVDAAMAQEIRIRALNARNRPLDAVRLGIAVLRDLGLRFPNRPGKRHIIAQILRTRVRLSRWKMDELLNFPKMQNPVQKAIIQILGGISTAAYIASPNYYPLFVLRVIAISLRHGYTPETSLGYQSLAVILCGVMHDIDKGYAYGRMSLRIADQFSLHHSRVVAIFNSFIRFWKENVRETLHPLIETYEECIRNGDIEYAGYAIYTHLNHAFLAGLPLNDVEKRFARYVPALIRMNHVTALNLANLYYQTAINIQGRNDNPTLLAGDAYDERRMLPRHFAANDRTMLYSFYLAKTILHFLFHENAQARDCAENARKYGSSAISIFASAVFVFYDTLIFLAAFDDMSRFERIQAGRRIKAGMRRMKQWAASCPANFMGKYLILDAEFARIHMHHDRAMQLYDEAIAAAIEQGLPHEAALANELAAGYCIARGRLKMAVPYLLDAIREYERWGANAKIADLKKRHVRLLTSPFTRRLEATLPLIDVYEGTGRADIIDSAALMKALQTISAEIELERLMDRLMNILMENAGARKVGLVIEQNGELFLSAIRTTERMQVYSEASIPLDAAAADSTTALPVSIIRYVAHTLETVIVNHSRMDSSFRNDPYIVMHTPKSVLCLPALRQSSLIGILYLENELTGDAFTLQRIEILSMIASQAAVSLENARLYKKLKQEIAEREKTEVILWENEKQFRLLAENATDIIATVDFDLKIAYISPSVKTALGYAVEEVNGVPFGKILTPASLREVMERYKKNIARIREGSFQPGKLELEFVTRDGAFRTMEATVSVIHDETRQPLNFLMVARDITERKASEETIRKLNVNLEQRVAERTRELEKSLDLIKTAQDQLVQSEKLASLGSLVAGIAHEINTPVGVGVTAASFLGDETAKFTRRFKDGLCDDFGIEKYVKTAGEASAIILSNMQRAADLISSFKQVAVDQSRENRRKFNLNAYLSDLLLSLQPRYKRTGHRIEVDCADDIELNSYPGAFSQIITNLIVNSLMHAFDGIQNGVIHIRVSMDDEGLTIVYSDNGIGIPAESMKRIFDPFYTTKRGLGGSGLGMHIVYNLVTQKLKGRIACESEPFEGTSFHIRIPAASIA